MNSTIGTKDEEIVAGLELSQEATSPGFSFPYAYESRSKIWSELSFEKNAFFTSEWNRAKEAIKRNYSSRNLVWLGDIHFSRKNFNRALEYYEKAIAIDNTQIFLYQKLIFISISNGNINKADQLYEKLIDVSSNKDEYFHEYVLFKTHFFDTKETNKSLVEDVEEILNRDPRNYSLYNTCGFLYAKLGNQDLAKHCFKKAVEINPLFHHALNNLGTCYLKDGDIGGAIDLYKKAIESESIYLAPYENLAQCYISKKRFKDVVDILEEAVSKGLTISDIWEHQLAWVYIQQGNYSEAIKWYLEKIKEEPLNDLIFNNLGYCYIKTGNLVDGKRYLNRAISLLRRKIKIYKRIDKRSLLALYNRARIFIKEGDEDGVNSIIKEISLISSKDPFMYYLMGSLRVRAGEYDLAKKYFLEADSADLDIPELSIDFGFLYSAIEENYEKAIEVLEKSIQRGNKEFLLFNNLVYSYIEGGYLERAKKMLTVLDEKNPFVQTNLGMLAFRLGDEKRGDRYYSKAVKLLEDNSTILARQYWLIEKIKLLIRNSKVARAKELFEELVSTKETYLKGRIERLGKELDVID